MATNSALDPQYQWILPKYLEPTEELRRCAEVYRRTKINGVYYASLSMFMEWLSDGSEDIFDETTRDMCTYEGSHKNLEDLRKRQEGYEKGEFKIYGISSASEFARLSKALVALQHFGLDIHGGLERLAAVRFQSMETTKRFPATSIIVVDAKKAQKYFNIGFHMESEPDLQIRSPSLRQASLNYAKVAEVLGDEPEIRAANEEIDRNIESELGIGRYADLKWEFQREKFRLQTRRRYRDVLCDRVLNQKDSETRERKPAKTDA